MGFSFSKLITFDLANNHFGSVNHAERIAKSVGALAKQFPSFSLSLKLQYRDLDSFFHPAAESWANPYVSRFKSTRLHETDFSKIIQEVRRQNLTLGITPFDEASVDRAVAHGADYLKVASCSAEDWPLLEKIRATGKPVVVSTGGLDWPAIERVEAFFSHSAPLAIMHCIALYPSDVRDLRLGCIRALKERFPHLAIGYSGHEKGSDALATGVAVGNGAELFERHIAYPSEQWKNNDYSLLPAEAEEWLKQLELAWKIQGTGIFADRGNERQTLSKLQRGVFAKAEIPVGQAITRENTYLAFPKSAEQNSPAIFGTEIPISATRTYQIDEGLNEIPTSIPLAEKALALYRQAELPNNLLQKIELSHHHGLQEFSKIGCFAVQSPIDPRVKYLILLANQQHPLHQHQTREERFRVLYGDIRLRVDGQHYHLHSGEEFSILPGQWHEFSTDHGAVLEETILGNLREQSIYFDPTISKQKPSERKTIVNLAPL
jgi:sialic acid synthase SpsE/mannose-6-phosphate isomerase-like protein (cupin superfamily)